MSYWAGALLLWLAAACMGLVPPASRDAMNDHLMLPFLWQRHGLFWRDAWLSFTANPPLADIPYVLFAGKTWDVATSVWHALGALVTLLLLARVLRQYDLTAGQRGWGVLMWMAMPTSLALCGWAYYLRRDYGADFGREGARLVRHIRHGEGFPFTHVLMNRRLAQRSLVSELGEKWSRWLRGTCLLARQGDFELRSIAPCR